MIFDRWGNPLGDLPYAIKAIRTRATDGTDTLDITTIGEINKDERIVFKDSLNRWAEYLCQSTQTARAAGMPVTVAYCTGSIAELSRTYIEDKRNRNANAKACLAKALEGTRWAVGTVETGTLTGTADLAFYHCTVLEAVQKTADTYGLEVQTEYQPDPTGNRIGQRIIHLLEHRGSTSTTKRFEYGKDLTQIKRDIDSGDVITRLYGWGKGIEQTNEEGEATGGYGRKISFADVNNGKPYIQDDNALANWGIVGADGTKHHSEASADFPDCEDPKELLNLTKAALKTRTTPVVSYTADVTALGQAGYDPEGTDVGDSVQIIDTSFTTPLRLEGRILQIEEDLAGSLADTKITLGNIRQTYTQRMAAQQQALDKLVSNSGAWNSAAGGTGPYMKDLIDRINQIMNATGGYTYLKPGQGIYVYDKPEDQNPTQCIHIGGGYWRIADHKKPNGDWDFRALANGKGIFADTVFTGRLSDAAGLNYWDMDTGEFRLAGTSTIAGNKASDLATTTAAQRLTSEAEAAAKKYADGIGSNTLASAKADATSKANAAQSAAAADATKKANSAEANAKKAASTDATNKANAALEAAKKAAADGDTSTLEAAKSYADNTATSHVNTFEKALTQQYIFNKLTNNGQLQGLYMSGGLLYVNATYLRSGIISGARSYWNLDSGIFSMTDANGVETVHLDGSGGHNTLTGTFQTGTSGSRLWMSPKFKQKPIGGTADITGAGISFIHATDAAQQPYIAAESTNTEAGEISTLTFNGGRRANTDPGAFVRVGSTKTDNAKMRGVFQALVMRDYSLSSNDAKSSGARLVSSASPDTNAMDTYSELAAWDPNGAVGVKADINTGYLYIGGFLGGYTNRHTFIGAAAWKAWMPNGGAISVGAAATVHFTASSPAKYGRYYAVANADGEWGGIIMHVKNTGGQSGWDIQLYNADRNACSVDMWCGTFGWLVK
jgi:phage minor structural protein